MIAMTAYKNLLVVGIVLAISLLAKESQTKREKRSTPIVTDIYTLDHFIEIIEKIEVKVTEIYLVADYIRSLAYNDEYWKKVIGPPKALPSGILTSTENRVLTKMVSHVLHGRLEQGVVRTPSGETITIGSVMTGIMAGIYRKRKLTLNNWADGATKEIDNLYAATLAKILAETSLAKKNTPSNEYFGPGGSWDSNKCPATYNLPSSTVSKASDAQLLGAVDGFILGYGIQAWARDSRLGQILRMYYSTEICFDKSFASCKRIDKLKELTNKEDLSGQVSGVAEAIYLKTRASYPNVDKGDITQISDDVAGMFFPKIEITTSSQSCVTSQTGCELPANLVFLMDESGSILEKHFTIEKEFVSQIVEALNISPRQTKVGLIEFASTAAIDFPLDLYGSKTRLKCAISETKQQLGRTNTAGALDLARTQIFLPLLKQQTLPSSMQYSRNNIIILLTDGKSNVPNDTEIYAAIKRIKHQVKDLIMIAVGVGNFNSQELKAIATDPDKHLFTADNFDRLLTLVKTLQNQTCSTPLKVNFDFKNKANVTYLKAFVSPGERQLLTVPPSQFFGSSIFLDITPLHGNIRLYTSRTSDTPGPNNYDYKLDPIPNGQTVKVAVRDACQGAPNASMCKPLYLGIYHDETMCTCKEKSCFLPGQIMFTLSKGDPPSASCSKPSVSLFSVFLIMAVGILKTVSNK